MLPFARLNPAARIYMQHNADGEFYSVNTTDGQMTDNNTCVGGVGEETGEGQRLTSILREYRYIGIDKKILSLPQVQLLSGDTKLDDEHDSAQLIMTHNFKTEQIDFFVRCDAAFPPCNRDLLLNRINAIKVRKKEPAFVPALYDYAIFFYIKLFLGFNALSLAQNINVYIKILQFIFSYRLKTRVFDETSDSEWYKSLRTDEKIRCLKEKPETAFHPAVYELIRKYLPDMKGRRILLPSSGDNHAALVHPLL